MSSCCFPAARTWSPEAQAFLDLLLGSKVLLAYQKLRPGILATTPAQAGAGRDRRSQTLATLEFMRSAADKIATPTKLPHCLAYFDLSATWRINRDMRTQWGWKWRQSAEQDNLHEKALVHDLYTVSQLSFQRKASL
ncbi:MAG: hypothetical protein U0T81_05760 [Saprospiraceae bacterium]